ncbi:hypothetical protein LCGC14_0826180, partial [marine sediment metagenome]
TVGQQIDYEAYDLVQYGDIMDDNLGTNTEFVVSAWIYPTLFSSSQNPNGVKNLFFSKAGNFELGINESGFLQVYINTFNIEANATYGRLGAVKLGEWNYIALRYNNSNVDVLIGDSWFYNATGPLLEPWNGGGNLASGGKFSIGGAENTDSCFMGAIDEVSVFNKSITNFEIEVHHGLISIKVAVKKDNGLGGWTSITPDEIIDGSINFEANITSGIVDKLEFYIANYEPSSLNDPVPSNWSLLRTINDIDDIRNSVVIDSHSLPDEDEWYFIVKAIDSYLNPTFKIYTIPFGIKHFNDTIEFYYDDVNGRINQNSHIGIVPLDGFESYINTTNIYINYSDSWDLLNLEPINYSDISSNYDLIDLDLLTSWVQTKGLTPENYLVNFNITFFLNYGPEFGLYNYTYRLNRTILDIKGPDITLNYNTPYSLELGKTYSDSAENILTGAIDFTDSDFDTVRLEYSYSISSDWIIYDTFLNTSRLSANFSMNILNLKDDIIDFRFIAVDDLGNIATLTDSTYWIIKDFDNHKDFMVEYLDDSFVYSLNQFDEIDIMVKAIPFDNDITHVIVSTGDIVSLETFNLTNKFEENDNIYFSDEVFEDIRLNSTFYNIIPGEFTLIPINVLLYQNSKEVTSKQISIIATDTVFSEAVNISDIEIDYDMLPQTDNVWMSFTTGTFIYKNLHEIPFIVNNKYPKINILDSTNTIIDSFTLKAISDGLDTQDYFGIEINDSIFRLSLPSLQPGEEISHIYEIIIDSVSYTNFSFFIDSQDIFIKLVGTGFTVPKDITLNFETSNTAHLTQQFVGTYDFQALAQGNYTLVGKFYDISGTISTYNISSPFKIDFEGPSIYSQFNNGFSVDPTSGNISFIIKDSSDIISYQFNVSLAGSWIIDKGNYTFIFNDNALIEGINNYQLICEDSLNFISTKDFSLNLDKSAPAISNIYSDSNPWNGIFLIKIDIDDISPYSVSLKCINTVSGVIYDSLDISFITTEISSTKTEWQILLDTNQLLNGKYDIIVTVIDEAGILTEISRLDYYFDNAPPDLTLINNDIYAEGSVVYSIEPAETLYLSDQEFISILANDELFDGFNWATTSYPYLELRLGIEAVTMYHTKPLSYHDINLGTLSYNSLVYEILDYDLGNTNIDRIKSIQKIKIGAEEIDKFTIYLIGSSLYIEIDEEYRFLLSSSSQVQALFYELEPQGISLTFDSNNIKWLLETLTYGYFDISYHLPGINQGDQFLFWFTVEDGLKNIVGSEGNQLISREYKGIYDNIISGTPTFEWNLGETSSSEGILIFGSENYGDSTIDIDISSIALDENEDIDVQRIMVYGSNDGIVYTLLGNDGRAYFSDEGIWSFYWDYKLGVEDPVDYYIKTYIFDKAGNLLSPLTQDVKLYDYNAIILLTDLVFGDIIEYDDSLPSNIYDFTGSFYLQNTPINLWDVVAQYYNPLGRKWVPLYSDPAVIQTYGPDNGSYTITWDINQDKDFFDSMYNFTYEFLPLRVTPTTSNNIWGSWGVFDQTDEWKPIILLDIASQIDFVIYEFDSVNGWIVDTALSSQDPINVITDQTFRIFDIDGDGIEEIIRVSPSQVDVMCLDQSSNWVIKQDVINDPELQYSIFDLTFNEVIKETTMVLFQLNLTSGSTDIGKYYFDTQYNLIQIQKPVTFINNLVPNSINIDEDLFSTISILVGAITSGTSLSQLIHYDFNIENENVLDDSILGSITSIETETINGIKTIVLGISREFIGKMDTVICLKFNTELDSWVEYEINDFDESRLKIYDMIFINDNSFNKLIISTDSGLFRSTIEYVEEQEIITDPIKFTKIFYSYDELNDNFKLSGVTRFIITDVDETPIYQVNKIFYKYNGIWYELVESLYYITHSRFAFDLQLDSSIWNLLPDLKIAYSFISSKDEVRHSIDPSFNTYGSTSTVSDISASSKFFSSSALPLLWLNPTSTITDPFADWRSLENLDWNYRGLNYRYLPVSSGLGTSVLYPTRTQGWGNQWGTEYISLPELENSLIYYGNDGYDSGILSQYLTGEDDLLGEDEFDGEFSGNYLDSVYISNPVISESFDFAELYYSNIHTTTGTDGIYDETSSPYDDDVLVRNRMTDFDFTDFNEISSGLSHSGSLPSSSIYQYLQGSPLEEIEYTLSNWNDYLSLLMDTPSIFEADFTYKLPLVDRAGLESIQVAFDASIVSSSINDEFPLSLRIFNWDLDRWETLPIAPITTGGFYNQLTIDYDFWTWNPSNTITPGEFRPFWGTTDLNNMNTLSFGINYPYIVNGGNIEFVTQFNPELGANFLDTNGVQNHDLNSYWSFKDRDNADHHKLLFYDASYNTNSFQFDNIIIDPDNFYTSSTTFPELNPSTQFENVNPYTSNPYTSDDFYDFFINDNDEIRFELITEKEVANPSDAYLTIGDFKTYVHTDSNYLNYEDFDSNMLSTHPMQHISDKIDLTASGLELMGESGFNIKNLQTLPIFSETFDDSQGSPWLLDNVPEELIYITSLPADDSWVDDLHPGTNYGSSTFVGAGETRLMMWPYQTVTYYFYDSFFKSPITDLPFLGTANPTSTVLNMYAYDVEGYLEGYIPKTEIWTVGPDWDENLITEANPPEKRAYTNMDFTPTSPGWYSFDLSGYEGVNNLGFYGVTSVTPESSNWKAYSKEYSDITKRPYFEHELGKTDHRDGFAYMQTDINEILSLKSSQYSNPTELVFGDIIEIEFKTTSVNEIKLEFYNDGQQLDTLITDSTIVQNGNINFNKQIIYITVDDTQGFTFDQLEFIGNFNPGDNFIAYGIKATRESTIQNTLKVTNTYDFIDQASPQYPILNYGSTSSGAPNDAHISDSNYWRISSSTNRIEIDFLFEGESDLQNIEKLEINFKGSGSIILDGNIDFSYYNYLSGSFEPLSYSLINNVFVLTLFNYDFDSIKDQTDLLYKLLLKVIVADANQFTMSIDSLTMKALELWSVKHDLYKSSFVFTPLDANGEIRLYLNRNVYTTIIDSQYTVDQPSMVSFYYDTNKKEWWIYLDDLLLSGPISDPNPLGINPRIESHFTTDQEGIKVLSITSQYFKKVESKNDFEDYKTLITSYKEGGDYTSLLDIDSLDSLLIAENTFSQISSDIDIIYNFKDGITENNIFNKNLVHSEDSSYSDSLETIPYNYQEEIVLPLTSINPTKDYVTAPLQGTKYQVTGGSVTDLQSDDDFNTITIERDAYTNHEPSYSPHTPIEGYNSVRGYPRRPIFTSSSPQSDHLYFTGTSGGFSVRIDEVDGGFWSQFDDGWIHSTTQYAYNMDHYKIRTNWFNSYTWVYEEMEFDTKYDGVNPTTIYFEFKIKVDIISDNGNGATIDVQNPSTQNWVTMNMLTNDDQFHWYYSNIDSSFMDTYVDDDGKIKIRIKSYAREYGAFQTGTIEIWTDVARCIAEYLPESKVEFSAGTAGNNYYLSYEGKTTGSAMNFYINDVPQFQIGTSWNQHEEILVMDLSNMYVILGELDQGWISDRILESDYLYLIDINQATSIPIYNTDTISLASTSKHFNTTQSSWLEDPFLGPTMQYTLENTVITPIFGRAPEPIHTQLELDSIELEFDVFPSTDSELLQDGFIEGKDVTKYDIQTLDYASGRFKNTAIDDAQIPLVTPIELDFGQINTQGLSNIDLEIALDLDISLDYRSLSSPDWILRSRMMIYNHTKPQWVDYTGIITTNGGTQTLWELDSIY